MDTLTIALFGVAIVAIGILVIIIGSVIKTQFKKSTTGKEGMLGIKGQARSILNPTGEIFLRGEIWTGVSELGTIYPGEEVEVKGIEGNTLKVSKIEQEV